ncbi:hypothetical protein EMIT0P4_60065 [Pseudomonas sp. IT-P4]
MVGCALYQYVSWPHNGLTVIHHRDNLALEYHGVIKGLRFVEPEMSRLFLVAHTFTIKKFDQLFLVINFIWREVDYSKKRTLIRMKTKFVSGWRWIQTARTPNTRCPDDLCNRLTSLCQNIWCIGVTGDNRLTSFVVTSDNPPYWLISHFGNVIHHATSKTVRLVSLLIKFFESYRL